LRIDVGSGGWSGLDVDVSGGDAVGLGLSVLYQNGSAEQCTRMGRHREAEPSAVPFCEPLSSFVVLSLLYP
jgi:hypothetical protein